MFPNTLCVVSFSGEMEPQKSLLMDESLCDIFKDTEFGDTHFGGGDLFSILESLEDLKDFPSTNNEAAVIGPTFKENEQNSKKVSISSRAPQDSETEPEISPKSKRQKLSPTLVEEPQKVSHITVERNRRKEMNENLSILRSLMPLFYVKRVRMP